MAQPQIQTRCNVCNTPFPSGLIDRATAPLLARIADLERQLLSSRPTVDDAGFRTGDFVWAWDGRGRRWDVQWLELHRRWADNSGRAVVGLTHWMARVSPEVPAAPESACDPFDIPHPDPEVEAAAMRLAVESFPALLRVARGNLGLLWTSILEPGYKNEFREAAAQHHRSAS